MKYPELGLLGNAVASAKLTAYLLVLHEPIGSNIVNPNNSVIGTRGGNYSSHTNINGYNNNSSHIQQQIGNGLTMGSINTSSHVTPRMNSPSKGGVEEEEEKMSLNVPSAYPPRLRSDSMNNRNSNMYPYPMDVLAPITEAEFDNQSVPEYTVTPDRKAQYSYPLSSPSPMVSSSPPISLINGQISSLPASPMIPPLSPIIGSTNSPYSPYSSNVVSSYTKDSPQHYSVDIVPPPCTSTAETDQHDGDNMLRL